LHAPITFGPFMVRSVCEAMCHQSTAMLQRPDSAFTRAVYVFVYAVPEAMTGSTSSKHSDEFTNRPSHHL
jgi:hypothetical protein